MLIFLIESLVLIVIFTLSVVTMARRKKPIDYVYDYPTPIIDRCYELGLITQKPEKLRASVLLVKAAIMAVLGIPLGLLVMKLNHAETFWQGFLIVYGLAAVVCAYDVLLDIVWFCGNPKFVIPGTEDLEKYYKDYSFHVRASLRGLLLSLPLALVAGLTVWILA